MMVWTSSDVTKKTAKSGDTIVHATSTESSLMHDGQVTREDRESDKR